VIVPPWRDPRPWKKRGQFYLRRQAWQDTHLDGTTRSLLAEDAAISCASRYRLPVCRHSPGEGIWIEDATGRRYLDFHGNSVHHIGYGHPRLIAALKRQLDDLPFAPRRFTCEPAIELARKLVEISPGAGQGAVHDRRFRCRGNRLKIARAAPPVQNRVVLGRLSWAGFGAASVGGEALFRSA